MERVAVVSNAIPQDPSSRRRSGFTLVELLAVIMIIALLMALVTPAVMRARTSARNAAIKAEIDLLHMAIMNYKNEYGSFPPAVSVAGLNSPAGKHVQRLFPRSTPNPDARTPGTAIVRWLTGYTTVPTDPYGSTSGASRQKLFDFDVTRVTSDDQYYPAGKKGSPYLYISSAEYLNIAVPTNLAGLHPTPTSSPPLFVHVMPDTTLTNGVARQIPSWASSLPESDRNAWLFTISETPAERSFQRVFNPDTFQILCAGLDEEFGTDDDLSNFWKGTRKEYLDSLK
jgi:prepilin-type N-terminal cleavage/methylation domain-containing protein